MKPGIISIKAINDYRKRDIIPYIGLRYYLKNQCAQRDIWANEISTHLVLNRTEPAYFKTYHFKSFKDKTVKRRVMHLPGPNEALAEIALLTECSKHNAFKSHDCVFSYRLSDAYCAKGSFQHYFPGFKSRHETIADSCASSNIVLCTDIKKFYNSINIDLAARAWANACSASTMPEPFKRLGNKLLADHTSQSGTDQSGLSVLTGPLFSHLLANLVLADVDLKMYKETGGKYWRYVDDIAIAGSQSDVKSWRQLLAVILDDIGFKLHAGDKNVEVPACEWLESRLNYDDTTNMHWMSLVNNIKNFLVSQPLQTNELADAMQANGIRMPIFSYIQDTSDRQYLSRFLSILRFPFVRKSILNTKLSDIILQAVGARNIYEERINEYLVKIDSASKYLERRNLISKIRFCSGRLAMLSTTDKLMSLSNQLRHHEELFLLSEILLSISTRNVSNIVTLGTNATQSSAQILRTTNEPVICDCAIDDDVIMQSVAILHLNGLTVNLAPQKDTELLRFAKCDDISSLMTSDDNFIKEISSLHGPNDSIKHDKVLDVAFDSDEQLAFDVIDQIQQSSYA